MSAHRNIRSGLSSQQRIVLRLKVFELLGAACDAGVPCPRNRDLAVAATPMLGVEPTVAQVTYVTGILCDHGQVQSEYNGHSIRRLRVRRGQLPSGGVLWSAWTGWTEIEQPPSGRAQQVTSAGHRRAVAASLRELNPPPPKSRTGQLIEQLLGQGFRRETVARMAGLRPHEMDLVALANRRCANG